MWICWPPIVIPHTADSRAVHTFLGGSGGQLALKSERWLYFSGSITCSFGGFFWQKLVFPVRPLSKSLFWDMKIIAYINYSSVPYFNCHFLVNLKNCQSNPPHTHTSYQSRRTQQIAWGREFYNKTKKTLLICSLLTSFVRRLEIFNFISSKGVGFISVFEGLGFCFSGSNYGENVFFIYFLQ